MRIPRFSADIDALGHRLAWRLVGPIERWVARRNQSRHCGRFVAVTGSVGKSTAASLTAQLLRVESSVAVSRYDNDKRRSLRVIRKLTAPVDFVVQEVSAHHPGALDMLLGTLRVDVGVVTAVGLDHYAAFRTDEAVAREKGRLVEAVGPSGTVCLNADDPHVRAMAERCRAGVVLFGTSEDATVRAEHVSALWPERLSFDLVAGGQRLAAKTRFAGTLMLPSILAALSVVHACGHDLDRALDALARFEPLPDRLGVVEAPPHSYLVDTFKASLWSTRRLIADLPNLGATRRIVVLGDMSDVGNDGSRKYRQVLQAAAEVSDLVIAAGQSAIAARRLTSRVANIVPADSLADVSALLAEQPASLVLLKTNRTYPLRELVPPRPPGR